MVDKLILASAFYKRSATAPQFWEGFEHATMDMMPQALKEGYLKANNNAAGLSNMFQKNVEKTKGFKGWTDDQMKSIQAATLIINARKDVGSPEHAVEMYRAIPNSELAIFTGGHGAYLGAIEALEQGFWPSFNAATLIEDFLDKA